MAGKLVQVATETVTSTTNTVSLTGINTDDVYMVAISGATCDNNAVMSMRVTVSGSADTTSNYDRASKGMQSGEAFGNYSATNQTYSQVQTTRLQNGTSLGANAILYLYNFNNSSEYSFVTNETSTWREAGGVAQQLSGEAGGFVHTVAQACDGLIFYMDLGTDNFTGGTFTLYKVL
jgi:hypothetical protein